MLFLCCMYHLYVWATTGRRELSECDSLHCQHKILTQVKEKKETWHKFFVSSGRMVFNLQCVGTHAKINVPGGPWAALAPSGYWTQIWNKVYFIQYENGRDIPWIVTVDNAVSAFFSHLIEHLWVSDLHCLMQAPQRENKCSMQQSLLMIIGWMTVIKGSKFICCLVSPL